MNKWSAKECGLTANDKIRHVATIRGSVWCQFQGLNNFPFIVWAAAEWLSEPAQQLFVGKHFIFLVQYQLLVCAAYLLLDPRNSYHMKVVEVLRSILYRFFCLFQW